MESVAQCTGTALEWYFGDAQTRTDIVLCPSTCQQVQKTVGSRMAIVLERPE